MMSFKCLCQTHQCPIIISSKPRQRRRRRDQAASVIARRPLIAAAGDVRTAPRLGCCRRSGGNGGSGNAVVATPAAAQPKPSNLSFFSLTFCFPFIVRAGALPGGWRSAYLFTLFPLSCSFSPSRFPTSLFPLPSLPFCCSSTLFLLLFLPLPILPPFLPHFPRRCACPHLPVFPRLFSALRCVTVCVAPVLVSPSLPPSLPPSLHQSLSDLLAGT